MLHSIREIRGSKRAVSCYYHLSYTNRVFIVRLRLSPPLFSPSGNVIVYGNTIDIYTTAEALLSLGINGSRVHLVQPPLSSNVTCLNNHEIESAVRGALAEAGVSVYCDSILAQWNEGDDPDLITCAAFTTNTKPFKLQCSVSICFHCISFCLFFKTKTIKLRWSLAGFSIFSLSGED